MKSSPEAELSRSRKLRTALQWKECPPFESLLLSSASPKYTQIRAVHILRKYLFPPAFKLQLLAKWMSHENEIIILTGPKD